MNASRHNLGLPKIQPVMSLAALRRCAFALSPRCPGLRKSRRSAKGKRRRGAVWQRGNQRQEGLTAEYAKYAEDRLPAGSPSVRIYRGQRDLCFTNRDEQRLFQCWTDKEPCLCTQPLYLVLEGRNLAGLLGVPEQTEHAGEVKTELPGLQSSSRFVQQDQRCFCFQCRAHLRCYMPIYAEAG